MKRKKGEGCSWMGKNKSKKPKGKVACTFNVDSVQCFR